MTKPVRTRRNLSQGISIWVSFGFILLNFMGLASCTRDVIPHHYSHSFLNQSYQSAFSRKTFQAGPKVTKELPPPVIKPRPFQYEEKCNSQCQAILALSKSLVGQKKLTLSDQTFYGSSYALIKYVVEKGRLKDRDLDFQDVSSLYAQLERFKRIVNRPSRGDLIFFKDTIPGKTKADKADSPTLVGIISQIDPDGTIHFIYMNSLSVRKGVVNLTRLNDRRTGTNKVINSFIRVKLKKDAAGTRYLAGQLFFNFVRMDYAKDSVQISMK